MGKEILTFRNMKIEKNKFYRNQIYVPLRDIDIEKVLISNKIFFGENKYFIGYLYIDHEVKPLHIMLPKASTYVKGYDGQTK